MSTKEYRVRSWDTKELLATYTDLKEAKKDCKGRGWIPGNRLTSSKLPVAYVETDVQVFQGWDDNGNKLYTTATDGCIYNPRFK